MSHEPKSIFMVLACALCLSTAAFTAAEKEGILPIPDYEGDFLTRSYLAGDLGGTRTDLSVAGVARQTTRRTILR